MQADSTLQLLKLGSQTVDVMAVLAITCAEVKVGGLEWRLGALSEGWGPRDGGIFP